jgi:hypothetical protein
LNRQPNFDVLWFGFPSYQRICPADPYPPGFLLPIKKPPAGSCCRGAIDDVVIGWRKEGG